VIALARQLATYCREHSYDIALEALAGALNAESRYGEALAIANECLKITNRDFRLACMAEKAEALVGLLRFQEAKTIIERGLQMPAITNLDVGAKERLQFLVATNSALHDVEVPSEKGPPHRLTYPNMVSSYLTIQDRRQIKPRPHVGQISHSQTTLVYLPYPSR
jgi:hypothetical protein